MRHVLPSLNSSVRPLLASPLRFLKFMAVMFCAPLNCRLIQEPTPWFLVAQSDPVLPSYALRQRYLELSSELALHDLILMTGPNRSVARAQPKPDRPWGIQAAISHGALALRTHLTRFENNRPLISDHPALLCTMCAQELESAARRKLQTASCNISPRLNKPGGAPQNDGQPMRHERPMSWLNAAASLNSRSIDVTALTCQTPMLRLKTVAPSNVLSRFVTAYVCQCVMSSRNLPLPLKSPSSDETLCTHHALIGPPYLPYRPCMNDCAS